VDHSPAVAEYGILYPEAAKKFGNCNASSAGPAHGYAHLGKALAHYLKGIDEGGQGNYSGAVLIIMKDWYIQDLLKPPFYLKAARCTYILQVDSTKDILYSGNCFHDDRRIFGVDNYGKGIYASKVLEQNGLSFHNRDGSQGTYISQAQDGGSVRYHGHDIALGGVLINVVWILFDLATGFGNARGIS